MATCNWVFPSEKSSKALEDIEIDSSRPARFEIALMVFGDTFAFCAISRYDSPFSSIAIMRASFCFLSIIQISFVSKRFSFCYNLLLCDSSMLFLVIFCIRMLSE
jgi:hypothetical protein